MADAECPQVAGPELFLSPLKVVFVQAKIVRYNFFAITRFPYIEVLFHIFYYYGFKQNRSFYSGLRCTDRGSFSLNLYRVSTVSSSAFIKKSKK